MGEVHQEPTSIREALQGLFPESMEILEGEVMTAQPLQIKAVNDDKLLLGPSLLCVPRHLTDYQVTVNISGGDVDGRTEDADGHNHTMASVAFSGATMTVQNALQQGERVYLLSFNQGKRYYILDRKGAS